MNWPRGKYNGRRIVGIDYHCKINVRYWLWLPQVRWQFGEIRAHWLCFMNWLNVNFE